MTTAVLRALIGLAAIWAVAVIIPGPNFLVILHTAASRGRRAALATAVGCGMGTAVWGAIGFFGLSFLFSLFPLVSIVIRLLGSAYLIFAGIQMITSNSTTTLQTFSRKTRHSRAWKDGLLTTLANPKTAALASSVFSVSRPIAAPRWFTIVALGTILLISFSWYFTLACVASAKAVTEAYLGFQPLLTRTAGSLFFLFGLKLALSR